MTAPLRLDPRAGLVRGVRAAVLTVPAVGAAALAHGFADGCGNPLAIAAAAALCWPAAVALLGARRRLPALVLWLVVAQVVTHLLLERMCADGGQGLSAYLPSGGMLATHLGAVLATAVLLSRADAGLWTAEALIRAGARALRALQALPVVVAPVAPRTPFAVVEVPSPRQLWKAALPARRGPPVLAAA